MIDMSAGVSVFYVLLGGLFQYQQGIWPKKRGFWTDIYINNGNDSSDDNKQRECAFERGKRN